MRLRTLLPAIAALYFPAATAAGLGLHLGAEGGWGQSANGSGGIPTRALSTYSAYAAPGLRLGNFFVGAFGEYFIAEQLTEPAEVGNQNLRGSGYLAGPALGTRWQRVSLLAGAPLLGRHAFRLGDASGNVNAFEKPLGARITVGYAVYWRAHLTLSAEWIAFRSQSLGASTIDVSGDPLRRYSARLGLALVL